MKPSVGRIVIYFDGVESPAIVNRVFPDTGGSGAHGINCTAFPEFVPPKFATSVPHRSVAKPDSCWWDWPQREPE